MRKQALRLLALWMALLTGPGCIIGTWPTPEGQDAEQPGGEQQPAGDEECNDLDDDADGSVDEGCACGTTVRGCVARAGEQCGFGLQRCIDGVWQGCGSIGPPYTVARDAVVRISSVAPAAVQRDETPVVRVEVEPVSVCAGIVVPRVRLSLEAADPAMVVRAEARDDGVPPDAAASDGVYTGELGNPFGPGVPAQPLTLRAAAPIDDVLIQGTLSVPLEEP